MKKLIVAEKYKKYLPSKQFSYLIISCLVIGTIFFTFSGIFSKKSSFLAIDKKGKLESSDLTIGTLLQTDSDGDGVLDWEEALWGTDPNKAKTFEISDKDYIEQKRGELKMTNEVGLESSDNETEKFAKEFFASLVAMKQNGQLDSDTIKNVSTSLGQQIVDSNLIDKYTSQDIKLAKGDEIDTKENYYIEAGTLFEEYKQIGIGDELDILSTVVASGNPDSNSEAESKLAKIADAYQEYAQKMVVLAVPRSLAQYHLRIVNNANNTGVAVRNMVKIAEDPILGITGLSQYQQYSQDLIASVEELETFLISSGIM